jgi:hypothetical protein
MNRLLKSDMGFRAPTQRTSYGHLPSLASGTGPTTSNLVPEVDFRGIARVLGAESAIIRPLADLAALKGWTDAGAKGTFVADCRITSSVGARG